MWFDSWYDAARMAVVAPLTYAALVIMLRATGKRTLSKLNTFDLVVTVALGSTLATVLLNASVSIAEGVLALALLVVLQFVVSWGAMRFRPIEQLVKSEPTLVYRKGFVEAALRRERVTHEEVAQAARAEGHGTLDTVAAVVLESDGSFSILTGPPALRHSG